MACEPLHQRRLRVFHLAGQPQTFAQTKLRQRQRRRVIRRPETRQRFPVRVDRLFQQTAPHQHAA